MSEELRQRADMIAEAKRGRLEALEMAIKTRRRWKRWLLLRIVRVYNWLETQARTWP